MKPKHYLDFIAIDGGEDAPSFVSLGKAYRVLHGAFGGSGGKYAIALPAAHAGATKRTTGGVIRVFASSPADLYELLEKVRGHRIIRDYVRLGVVQDVPEDFNGKWQTWQRVQVQKSAGVNREKTIERATKTPFFDFGSSGGGTFPLRVIVRDAAPQVEEATPNSYGLAAGGNLRGDGRNMFSVPAI